MSWSGEYNIIHGKRVWKQDQENYRTENTAVFTSNAFDAVLNKYGIFHQRSCLQTSLQYGCVERNITVTELAKTMLHSKNMDYN